MVTLANVQGSSLVPSVDPALNLLLQSVQGRREEQKQTQAEADLNEQIRILTGGTPIGTAAPNGVDAVQPLDRGSSEEKEKALIRLAAINPQLSNSIRQTLERGDQRELQAVKDETEKGTRTALLIQKQPDFASKRRALTSEAQAAASRGEDVTRFVELSNLPEAQLELELQKMIIQGADLKTLTDAALKEQEVAAGSFSKSPGVIVKTETGFAQSIPVLNQRTGQFEQRLIPITGQPVSRLGETPLDIQGREIITAGEVASAKLKSELKLKPQIEADITRARTAANKKGELFTELNQMQAALPGLKTAVASLRDLALIATSTLGGKLFDAAVKETGFGSTKGATARAKFIGIVNNQVLPLLKPTFGGSFSVQEGESLKATMGDPDASPEQKLAQLDAFIDQKIRDVETKQAQLSQISVAESVGDTTPEGTTATNPQTGEKLIFKGGQWQPL